MKSDKPRQSLQRLVIRWGVPMALLVAAGTPPGKTQITGVSGSTSLGTLVNGSEGGSCSSGTCAITGGKPQGSKLFHRLSEFWAHSGISKVTIDNDQSSNNPYQSVILSNIDSYGTYIDTSVEFTTSKSDLAILSPGGIELGSGAHFTNIGSLALSTAENLVIGDEVFHFENSTESDLINMTAVIDLAQSAFTHNQAAAGQISIEVDETLSIDADLILHSIGGIDIKAAEESSDANLEIGDTLNISSNGKVNNEETPYSTEIKDVTINAESVSIEGKGGDNQTLAIFIKNSDIYAANQIDIKGTGGDETSTINNENLIGLEIVNSTIQSTTSGIYLSGTAGDGNEQISYADAYDFNNGTGLIIESSHIEAADGLVQLEGNGSFGSDIFLGHGIEIANSDVLASEIVATGISAEASPDSQTDESNGIDINNSKLAAVKKIDLTGESANTDQTSSDIITSAGVNIIASNLNTSAGPIKIEGTGGSGRSLNLSTGVIIDHADIRGSKVELVGTGGHTNDTRNAQTSIGVAIVGDTVLNTRTSVDSASPILINNQDDAINGDITIIGYGGSGIADSGGVFSTANIDSTGSIQIIGQGGVGQEDIYGVAIETLDDDLENGITKTINADHQIVVKGDGGTGTDIVDSNGVFLSDVEVEAGKGIYLAGQAGSSIGETSYDQFLDGLFIENTNITIHSAEAMTIDIDNPNEANIILHGKPGSSDFVVEGSSGVLIADSIITTKGGIEIEGNGDNALSLVSMDGDGILLEGSTIKGSSILLAGYGTTPVEPGFIDEDGNLVEQTSTGVEIVKTTIEIKDHGGDFDHSIDIDGFGGGGNTNVNGIILEDSTLTSPNFIYLVGETEDVDTHITEGRGVSITDSTTLSSHYVEIDGKGSTGTSTDNSSGVYIDSSFITGTSDVVLTGRGGSSDDSEGFAAAADGISLVGGSTITSSGNIFIDGQGGDSVHETTVTDGVYISDATIQADEKLNIYGKGGDGEIVSTSNGVNVTDQSTVHSGQYLLIDGLGGDAVTEVAETRGISLEFNSKVTSDGNIELIGIGGYSDYDTTFSDGILISQATIKAQKELYIEGKGGDGEIVETSNGVSIADATINSDQNLVIDGLGGDAEKSVIEARGVEIFNSDITSLDDLTLFGFGGILLDYASDTNESGDNQGIYLDNATLVGDNIDITGYSGDGGSLITGIEMYSNNITATNTVNLSGIGGTGETVLFAEGIYSVDNSISSTSGSIDFVGIGGSADLVKEGHGIISIDDDITLSEDQSLTIKGKGATAKNQVDSQDNTGVTLIRSSILSGNHGNIILLENEIDQKGTSIDGGQLSIIGIGGNGGKQNTGIELLDTDIISDGIIKLSGTGGSGTNIKKSIGVILGTVESTDESDDEFVRQLSAESIIISGKGGVSNLRKEAIDQNGEDTFGQTANNVGVIIDQYKLDATTGSLSISGTGGKLVVPEISKDEISEIFNIEDPTTTTSDELVKNAFALEGLTIENSTTTSTQATFLKGSAGKPFSGDKNSGTTITNSTIKSATSTGTLPGQLVDLDLVIVDANGSELDVTDMNGLELDITNIDGLELDIVDMNGSSLNNAKNLNNRIEGNAFSGTNEIYGITIDATTIESTNQQLTLAGQGGLKATGEKNYGIYILNGSVTVGSKNNPHDLKIYGAGGDGTDMTGGILTSNTSYTGFGKIDMVGKSLGSSGKLSDAIEIFAKASIKSEGDTTFSGNDNINVTQSSIDTGGDLSFNAGEDLNINESEIESEGDVNATAGNDLNINDTNIASQGDVNATAGNDLNINDTNITSQGDVNATAGSGITIVDSKIESNSTTLKADTVEIEDTSLSSDQNLEIIAISGLDITSSELDASDAVALNSYSIAVESSTVTTTDLTINSTELIQKESGFEANSYSINNEQNSDDNSSGALQSLGLDVNSSLQSAGSQANDSAPMQSNSELTMSLAGGVNYILDDSAQESSSNDSQTSTTTSSSETNSSTSASTGSDEGSSGDNGSVSSDASSDSESESEQAKSGDEDQEGKDDADSSKDQKTTKGSDNRLPTQKLTVKQTKQIHQESEAQSSKFVASQLGLPERPAMTIQEIQGMLTSGMASMNNSSQ